MDEMRAAEVIASAGEWSEKAFHGRSLWGFAHYFLAYVNAALFSTSIDELFVRPSADNQNIHTLRYRNAQALRLAHAEAIDMFCHNSHV